VRARDQRATAARFAAPVAFLVAVTVAVVLIKAGLGGSDDASTTTVVPVSTAAATTSSSKTTPARPAPPKPKPVYYEIQPGDTFGTVASKYDTSVEALQALNPGVSSNSLTVGQKIRVK
jgi:LysM repeat protein